MIPATPQVSTPVADCDSVDAAIASRFSCRAFLREREVPRALIEDILEVAARAPSGTNTQPWNVYVLQGASRDALVNQVCAAHDIVYREPERAGEFRSDFDYYPTRWTSPFIDRRRENGWGLYGLLGIQRGEKDKMHAQHQRNYRFFDAPVGLMFTISRVLGRGSLMDCAMYMQNVMVAARARGLHTCPQAAWLEYERVVMPLLGAPADQMLVSGLSLGYADPAAPVNGFHTPREAVSSFTRWV